MIMKTEEKGGKDCEIMSERKREREEKRGGNVV
jgi:hypothetical protein